MPSNTPPTPAPIPPADAPSPAPKRKFRWLLYGCGSLLALMLLIVATVAITIWWIQRPIKPVVLSASEKAVVDQKLQRLSGGAGPAGPGTTTLSPEMANTPPTGAGAKRVDKTRVTAPAAPPVNPAESPNPDRVYLPGSKVLKLTEREINGLLNANTDLGNTVRLEFARDAINAYLAVPIPQDFPVGGGKIFRARGRFRVSVGNGGAPFAILEDVTVFGLSLPKAWLGGLKGENLLGDAMGKSNGSAVLKGIKSLRVEPGALVLEVED